MGFLAAPPSYRDSVYGDLARDMTAASSDGRVDIKVNGDLARRVSVLGEKKTRDAALEATWSAPGAGPPRLKLNIVIHCVGSRGDVQPFIAIGGRLRNDGHRVRIATHDVFSDFVTSSGLEFFPVGGDPVALMAYMVKNPGLIPGFTSVREGEIQQKRRMIAEMMHRFWRSCIDPDPLSGEHFVADFIIANPPSYAHVHCAEAAGIPLHLVFTMPWTCTTAFPHPLANLKGHSDAERGHANYLSYKVMDWLTWQGLNDVVNAFRGSLDLERVPSSAGPTLVDDLKIPFTYCWSPSLVPKPLDWPAHTDVSGFIFRETPAFRPSPELQDFLSRGSTPIYVGFGSIVLDDPDHITRTVLAAVDATGVRAIISRGWSKIGGPPSDNIMYIDDCPHEWLFQHVSAVVHHGGAGTTACGLRNGCPTIIVPFFGDQPFWGQMVASQGAGPAPIQHKQLTAEKLSEGIRFCLKPETTKAAGLISQKMQRESGVDSAVASFYARLPLDSMQCSLTTTQTASWLFRTKSRQVKLSAAAAEVLIQRKLLSPKRLQPYQTSIIDVQSQRLEPVFGSAAALVRTCVSISRSILDIFLWPFQENFYKAKLGHLVFPAQTSPGSKSTSWRALGRQAAIVPYLLGLVIVSVVRCGVMLACCGVKGFVVDFPFAMAEGLRGLPGLWGETVVRHVPVRTWADGLRFAFMNALGEWTGALSGLVMQPYEQWKMRGIIGILLGIFTGILGFGPKLFSGALGLYAYPIKGISCSILALFMRTTSRELASRRRLQGSEILRAGRLSLAEAEAAVSAFRRLKD